MYNQCRRDVVLFRSRIVFVVYQFCPRAFPLVRNKNRSLLYIYAVCKYKNRALFRYRRKHLISREANWWSMMLLHMMMKRTWEIWIVLRRILLCRKRLRRVRLRRIFGCDGCSNHWRWLGLCSKRRCSADVPTVQVYFRNCQIYQQRFHLTGKPGMEKLSVIYDY